MQKRTTVSTPTKPLSLIPHRERLEQSKEQYDATTEVIHRCDSGMDIEDEKSACEALVTSALHMVGTTPEDHPACFAATVRKAVATHILQAKTWSGWSGYKDLNIKMTLVTQYTNEKQQYHSPTATQTLLAIILLKIRAVTSRDDGGLQNTMIKYRVFDHALSAIHYYKQYPNQILRFDQDFIQTQDPDGTTPNQTISATDKAQNQPSPTLSLQRTGQKNAINLLRNLRRLDETFKDDKATLLNDITEYTVEISQTVTREEVERELEEILYTLVEGNYPDKSLLSNITLPKLKVLTRGHKTLVNHWAVDADNRTIQNWKNQVTEDLSTYTWKEIEVKKLPPMWSNHPAQEIWKRVYDWATHNTDSSIIPDLILLKEVFRDQEERGVDKEFHQHLTHITHKLEKMSYAMTKRDHLVQNALESCEIAIVNNEMAFRELTETIPFEEEAYMTKPSEPNTDADHTKTKKNKRNKKSKNKQKTKNDGTAPNNSN
ncbi:hypothetical protein M441DRAFT_58169 [Trichoderma asperellum CBS 433.97]|uniref:Uncharacterized protein n=1 Tax=Trichoderma asperellum (strain ATCC 204424 / CBS 433.97 / NBRC 101777) TaxID=1042311 RepID=A0A2T3Z793_TRIA4|nr:hypothetical protein M441DRAFT_58169 [Trichoderma asperellum CBS 433.97]PTB40679.1 hypothetical protein M441DRAFT_58169 [Trichoderma asperellum CBS 433.97]